MGCQLPSLDESQTLPCSAVKQSFYLADRVAHRPLWKVHFVAHCVSISDRYTWSTAEIAGCEPPQPPVCQRQRGSTHPTTSYNCLMHASIWLSSITACDMSPLTDCPS